MSKENLKKEGDLLRQHLTSQFKAVKKDAAMPENLKNEVFNTLDTIQLMADVADLFTVKFTQSESQFIDLLNNLQSGENKSETHPED